MKKKTKDLLPERADLLLEVELKAKRIDELMMENSRTNMLLLQSDAELQRAKQTIEVIDLILADKKLEAIQALRQSVKLNVQANMAKVMAKVGDWCATHSKDENAFLGRGAAFRWE